MKNFTFLASILVLLFLFGCVQRSEKEAQDDTYIADTLLSAKQLKQIIPSPGEIFYAIQDQGLEYMPGLVHTIESPSHYPLFRNQALIFGVYLTDFSYLLLFEKQSETIQYLYLIQEYSLALGVEDYFNDEFFDKVLTNLSDPDSIRLYSIEQSALFFQQMERTGNQDLLLLATAGAMSEITYITSKLLDEKEITESTITVISDLSKIFDTFFRYYAIASINDQSLEKLTEDLKEVQDIFKSMSISHSTTATRKDDQLVLSSKSTHSIETYNVKRLKIHIELLRNRIINQVY